MLNTQQEQAVNSAATRIIVNAGPGTGKTTTLIAAASKFIQEGNKTILLTFTNKAADEMRNRLQGKAEFIGTIHGFALREIQTLSQQYNFRIRLLTDVQIKEKVAEILNELGYSSNTVNLITFYMTNRKEFLKRKIKRTRMFDVVEQKYINWKREIDAFDYTDTPEYMLAKMKQYDIILDKYDGLFIDEAQDLNEAQYNLFKRFICKKKFVIGDPKQSIYMWRGATEDIFFRFVEDGYELYNLTTNYRSYQEIIDYSRANLKANKGIGGKVISIQRDDHAVIENFLKLRPQILCRYNKEVREIEKFYPEVSTIHAAKGLEYDNVLFVRFDIDEDIEEENIQFVAQTRARNNMLIVNYDNLINYFGSKSVLF